MRNACGAGVAGRRDAVRRAFPAPRRHRFGLPFPDPVAQHVDLHIERRTVPLIAFPLSFPLGHRLTKWPGHRSHQPAEQVHSE
ncbi:hypothetical protein [Streptomyces sp. DB-54]